MAEFLTTGAENLRMWTFFDARLNRPGSVSFLHTTVGLGGIKKSQKCDLLDLS